MVMGGHGGLNILPQKKWNVYNWDNRDIVERDKRIHSQKERRNYEQNREQQLENKINVLKQENGDLPQNSQPTAAQSHGNFNLFEEEERVLQNQEGEELRKMKEQDFLKEKLSDYSSKFMGSFNDEKQLPWYSKKKGFVAQRPRGRHFKPLD